MRKPSGTTLGSIRNLELIFAPRSSEAFHEYSHIHMRGKSSQREFGDAG